MPSSDIKSRTRVRDKAPYLERRKGSSFFLSVDKSSGSDPYEGVYLILIKKVVTCGDRQNVYWGRGEGQISNRGKRKTLKCRGGNQGNTEPTLGQGTN